MAQQARPARVVLAVGMAALWWAAAGTAATPALAQSAAEAAIITDAGAGQATGMAGLGAALGGVLNRAAAAITASAPPAPASPAVSEAEQHVEPPPAQIDTPSSDVSVAATDDAPAGSLADS